MNSHIFRQFKECFGNILFFMNHNQNDLYFIGILRIDKENEIVKLVYLMDCRNQFKNSENNLHKKNEINIMELPRSI